MMNKICQDEVLFKYLLIHPNKCLNLQKTILYHDEYDEIEERSVFIQIFLQKYINFKRRIWALISRESIRKEM